MKKKIAVIGLKGLPAHGGAATVGESIIEQLKNQYSFTVYSVDSHTEKKTGYYNGFEQIVFKSIKYKKINTLLYYLKSTIHALSHSYDVIHLHHRDAAFLILLLKLKYYVVVTTHGIFMDGSIEKWKSYQWYFDLQVKYFLKNANRVTCVSKGEDRILNEQYNINALYIPNGVTIIPCTESPVYTDYILFAAGRLLSIKGCHILLKSLIRIKYEGQVIVTGDYTHEPKYYSELLELSKNLSVKFVGLIREKSSLYGLLKHAKLFIFPSTQEAMSIMLLEAAGNKCPIICSDIESNMDIFNDDEMLFFESDSIQDLAEKIKWALKNKMEMKRFAQNAYSKCVQEYSWGKIASQYESIFESLFIRRRVFEERP
jgi:glycosyltransferase involved in cell wall biosynthesis